MKWQPMTCNDMPCHATPWNVMQRQAISCHAIPCNTIQCHPTQRHSMSYNTRQCHVRPCNAVTCNAMQCNAMPRNATPRHATPFNAMQHHTTPWNTIQCHTKYVTLHQNWHKIVATMYHHTKGTNCRKICHIAPKIGTILELPYVIIPNYPSAAKYAALHPKLEHDHSFHIQSLSSRVTIN